MRLNLSEQTDMMDLLGAEVPAEGEGAFAFVAGQLLRAVQDGAWVLLVQDNLSSLSLSSLSDCLPRTR